MPPTLESARLVPGLRRQMRRWEKLWNIRGLAAAVDISFSRRMSRVLANCRAERKIIYLNSRLVEPEARELVPAVSSDGMQKIATRSDLIRQDFEQALVDPVKLRRLLIQNPIAVWIDGKGMGSKSYFDFKDDLFSGELDVGDLKREKFQDLVREIAEWRREEYLHRLRHDSSGSKISGATDSLVS